MQGSPIAVLALASSALVACSRTPSPGKPVSIAAVCGEPDESRVRLQGYLRPVPGLADPCSTRAGGRRSCRLELRESSQEAVVAPDASAPPSVSPTAQLALRVGDDPAEMNDLPSNFSGIGVVVHLESGANAVNGSHVTIDGFVTRRDSASSCVVEVDRVQAGAGS